MICRISGSVVGGDGESTIVLDVGGGLCYELMIPTASLSDLQRATGETVTLHTIQYLEGSLGGGNLTPRLLGFLSPQDRAFFHELTRVKGVSTRKALRAMGVAVHLIAGAIERGDEKFLTSLPEIGKKTAAQMVTELRGSMQPYCATTPVTAIVPQLNDAQRVAVEILVRWGDRRVDAERWIASAVEASPELTDPEAIVRAAYRFRATTS